MEFTSPHASKILKWAFAGSILIYFALTFLVQETIVMDMGTAQLFTYTFLGLAVVNAGLQFTLPRRISTEPSASIVRYALCESVGIFGLVLFLIGAPVIYAWVLMALATLLLLFGERSPSK